LADQIQELNLQICSECLDVECPTIRSNHHDRDEVGASLSWIEFGTNGLLQGESAALIAAKAKRRRTPSLQEGDKRDLDRRTIVSNNHTELYNTDRTADAGGRARKGAPEENISASGVGRKQARHKGETTAEALHGSPRLEH
jgi:hypothetical protein